MIQILTAKAPFKMAQDKEIPTQRLHNLRSMLAEPSGRDLIRLLKTNCDLIIEEVEKEILDSPLDVTIPEDKSVEDKIRRAQFYNRAAGLLEELTNDTPSIDGEPFKLIIRDGS